MELRRYRKNHKLKPETVDSSEFVAFWSDTKFVCALDRQGVEWMLHSDFSLQKVEAGVPELVRCHRGVLVRMNAVDRLITHRRPGKRHPGHYCVVNGKEFAVSRHQKDAFHYQYRTHVAQHGFMPAAVAA